MLRLAFISNVPPPYRIPLFQKLGQIPEVHLQVLFCAEREPNRLWDLPPLQFDHRFLHERYLEINGRYIHNNPDVVLHLKQFPADVIITDGFNPTHLYAFSFARWNGLPHVTMTDGTDTSEKDLSKIHRIVRHFVYNRSDAFVAASLGGRKLYESYGIHPDRCFTSCLCIDNETFSTRSRLTEKRFDFIFSGRIEDVKNPLFALDVTEATAKKLGRKTSILFVGSGTMECDVKSAAFQNSAWLDAEFHGFASQEELPALYQSARIFLFPTKWDPWGVVANEACAAGLPVIVSPHAGVADDLIIHEKNGFVLALQTKQWAEHAALLLTRNDIWLSFSEYSLSRVNEYTFDKAVSGVLEACRFSLSTRHSEQNAKIH